MHHCRVKKEKKKAIVFTGERAGCLRLCVSASLRDLRRRSLGNLRRRVVQRPLRGVSPSEIRRAAGVLVPGGDTWPERDSGKATSRDGHAVGAQMPVVIGRGLQTSLRRMVEEGGVYVGVCGGAFLGACLPAFELSNKVRPVWAGDFGDSPGFMEGHVRLRASCTAPPEFRAALRQLTARKIYYENGPLFHCQESRNVRVLATFGSRLQVARPHPAHLRKALARQPGKAAAVACRLGRGCVVLLSPHPELTTGCAGVLALLWRGAEAWAAGSARPGRASVQSRSV